MVLAQSVPFGIGAGRLRSVISGSHSGNNRPNNLYEPVPGDHGAHGKFDARAHDRSLELWAETHARLLTVTGGVGFAAAVLSTWLYGRKSPLKKGRRWARAA